MTFLFGFQTPTTLNPTAKRSGLCDDEEEGKEKEKRALGPGFREEDAVLMLNGNQQWVPPLQKAAITVCDNAGKEGLLLGVDFFHSSARLVLFISFSLWVPTRLPVMLPLCYSTTEKCPRWGGMGMKIWISSL